MLYICSMLVQPELLLYRVDVDELATLSFAMKKQTIEEEKRNKARPRDRGEKTRTLLVHALGKARFR